VLGEFAYSALVQSSLAQANYFRDPLRIPDYLAGCLFLPSVLDDPSDDARERLRSLERLVLVMAERDTMIFPKESEHFAAYTPAASWLEAKVVVPPEQCAWYDALGLRSLAARGALVLTSTAGDHLQFSLQELRAWVDEHFLDVPARAGTGSSVA